MTKKGVSRGSAICLRGRREKRIQRYRCKDCGTTFSLRRAHSRKRYGLDVRYEVVKRYLEDGTSYRKISKRLKEKLGVKTGRTTVCKMVHEAGKRCKAPSGCREIADFLNREPGSLGYIENRVNEGDFLEVIDGFEW